MSFMANIQSLKVAKFSQKKIKEIEFLIICTFTNYVLGIYKSINVLEFLFIGLSEVALTRCFVLFLINSQILRSKRVG